MHDCGFRDDCCKNCFRTKDEVSQWKSLGALEKKQVLERAHAHRLTVIGATITPVEDTTQQGYYTPANEAARQEVNQWIRTGRAYDAVVDFDMLLRDPSRPTKLHLPLASPDFIHPNEAGYREMGRAIDPALFSARAAATATAAR